MTQRLVNRVAPQCVGLVRDRAGNVVVGLGNRHPREVLPDTLSILLALKRFVVDGAEECVVRVVKRVCVVDEVTCLEAFELIFHCSTGGHELAMMPRHAMVI